MVAAILAKKIGMTHIFNEQGDIVPVTVLEAGPCIVVQLKTAKKDSYNAVQLGFLPKKNKRMTAPLLGHFKKAGGDCFYYLKEFRFGNIDEIKVGQQITVAQFRPGDVVRVTARSKGRGFSGVIKRYGFKRGPETHGSRNHRGPKSIGAATFPGRVIKGKKMPGQMGYAQVTVKNIKVIDVRPEYNLLLLKGSVPGSRNSLVTIKKIETRC
jgi:large subunit ribosomal protein L3